MLTRLKVSGFKNLVDVDVRFGPFTCVAGPNGVGKSNLFDAIQFLGALSEKRLMDAALSVRDSSGRVADVRSLFHRVGNEYAPTMSFMAEIIIPREGEDDLGQKARATITFLRYSVTLGYRDEQTPGSAGALELLKEELVHITQREAQKHLLFPHTVSTWRRSAVTGKRAGSEFISTHEMNGARIIKLHQDQAGGRPLSRPAANLPRTILSSANAAESPTALLARREMQSWRLLQLEPSALRKSDEFSAPTNLNPDGSHLSAALFRLAQQCPGRQSDNGSPEECASRVYAEVANRLAELIDDVREVWVDQDERRELLTLHVRGRDGTAHAARSLSDGTLRFLALAVLAQDPEARGVLCLEEPENGIHPDRIPAMLRLLQDIATDVDEPLGPDNPLRQVIVNTHSPVVVQQVPDHSLLVAELREYVRDGHRFSGAVFSCLPDTWRVPEGTGRDEAPVCSKGQLLSYLNPVAPREFEETLTSKARRVVDREDMQLLLPLRFESR